MLLGANRGSDTQDFINKQTPFLPSLKIVPSPPNSIHPKQTKTWSEQYLHTPRRIHSCGCLGIVPVTSEGASSSLCGVSQLLECRLGTTASVMAPYGTSVLHCDTGASLALAAASDMNGPLTLTYTPHHAGTKQPFLLSVLNMSESREAGPMGKFCAKLIDH